MVKTIALCSSCKTKIEVSGEPGQNLEKKCSSCNHLNKILLTNDNLEELEIYPIDEPYEYVKIVKNVDSLDKYYWAIQPDMANDEIEMLNFIQETLISDLNIRLDQIEGDVKAFLHEKIDELLEKYEIEINDDLKKKIYYYINRKFVGFDKIDPLMKDPYIEDISCDGSEVPIFLYHRE